MFDLSRFVGTKRHVHIERAMSEEPNLYGYLLQSSATLALMHSFHDFMPDGYSIFRLEDVESCQSRPCERHFDYMLRAEGLLRGLNLATPIDLSDMRSPIESVAEHYEHFIIECEDIDEDRRDFYIGKLESLAFDTVTFCHFDALGCWGDIPSEIGIDDITKIQFDTPYINLTMKYLQTGPRPQSLDDED